MARFGQGRAAVACPSRQTLGITPMHVLLRLGERNGKADYEPVHVDLVAANRFRVLHSPGLAYGMAAGDELEVDELGRYNVVARAGNLRPFSIRQRGS